MIRFISIMLLLFSLCNLSAQKKNRPNVIVIYTDDHRYSGVHALGGEDLKTPSMDKLAEEGISFTKAYLMGAFSGATCIPSRAMLHTGRNLFELDGIGYTIPKEHTMMSEAFMDAGYHAHHVGKWHQDMNSLSRAYHSGGKVAGKPAYLTDQFRMPYSEWNSKGIYNKEDCYLLEYDNEGKVVKRPLSKNDKRGPTGTEKTGPHVSEVLADNAIDFLQNGVPKKKPFYMYLAFPTPHDPRQAPVKFKEMYPEDQIKLPPSYMAQHPFDNGHYVLRDEELDAWPRTEEISKGHLSDYYAIISHLDEQIGRVIATLKANGTYENTIIVFAGDSGLAVGNHGLLGKQNVYDEDGVHVPLIISGGLIKENDMGKRIDALTYIHDIFPTICDLAGIEKPETVSGRSLLPVIVGQVDSIRDHTYHAYLQFQRAYRKGDYKLIEYVRAPRKHKEELKVGSRVTQLFNLTTDPWETFDLAPFPKHQEKVKELRVEMKKKAVEIGDTADGKRVSVDFWNYF
ncbi:MAG: sulfatase-like hydrolase/transferase [Reichenbachiella sp.]